MCQMDGAHLKTAMTEQNSWIGKMINDRYRTIGAIAEGGMGKVYLAEQISTGRKLAVKILHPEFTTDQKFVKSFHQEMLLAASLNHPRVTKVFDFGQAEDGSLFIAMEHVEGKSLKEVIEAGPFSVEKAIHLSIQIAEGLQAAHSAGLVHGDIRPENILVVGEEAAGAKLKGFGIARLKEAGTAATLARSGMIIGIPPYIAPEQIQGEETSQRTDIYAFGVVLYEMMSGDVPFKAPTPAAVLMKHLQQMPTPLRKLRKEIPSWVELVAMKTLEKKPEKRPRDMQEIIEGLKKAQGVVEGLKRARGTLQHAVEKPAPKTPPAARRLDAGIVQSSADTEEAPKEKPAVKTPLAPHPVEERRARGVRLRALKFIGFAAVIALVAAAGIGGIYLYRPRATPRPFAITQPPVSSAPHAKIVSLLIRAEKDSLKATESTALKIQAQYSDGREEEVAEGVQWQSSDPSVLAVSGQGEAQAQKPGSASITARYAGMASPPLTLIVTAEAPDLPTAAPAARLVSLRIRADKKEINVEERIALALEGKYSDGKVKTISEGVRWQSSDRATAEVNSKGEVTAYKEGKVNITGRHQGIISSRLTLSVKGGTKSRNEQEMNAHIKAAMDHREQGEYSDALSELEKARAFDPANKGIQADIERTKRACNAEKQLGRPELTCQ